MRVSQRVHQVFRRVQVRPGRRGGHLHEPHYARGAVGVEGASLTTRWLCRGDGRFVEKDTGVAQKLPLDANLAHKVATGLGSAVGIANAVHLELMLWKMATKK